MPQSAGGRGKDYRESDVRIVLDHGGQWRSWSDAVQWLRNEGKRDDQLRSGDLRALMSRDFGQLERDRVAFTRDAGEAFRLARGHRPHHVGIEQT